MYSYKQAIELQESGEDLSDEYNKEFFTWFNTLRKEYSEYSDGLFAICYDEACFQSENHGYNGDEYEDVAYYMEIVSSFASKVKDCIFSS